MAEWPKTIFVKNLRVLVNSWEEFDELLERYGGEVAIVSREPDMPRRQDSTPSGVNLNHSDRVLLEQFVEAGRRGLTTKTIGPALGKTGKGIRPSLEAWSRRIGLVTQEGASAFEAIKGVRGRGFCLVGMYLRTARAMLGL